MSYPTELLAKATYEMGVFERVSATTGAELITEITQLRAERGDSQYCASCNELAVENERLRAALELSYNLDITGSAYYEFDEARSQALAKHINATMQEGK